MQSKNTRNAAVDFGSCSIVFLMCFLWANSSSAQNPFYQDKNITIVAATDAGGTADLRIRTVVAFLRKHIPENPNIVVEYMPGGGGSKAANHVYRTSRPDGLTMGAMLSSLVLMCLNGILQCSYIPTIHFGCFQIPAKPKLKFDSKRYSDLENGGDSFCAPLSTFNRRRADSSLCSE